MLELPINPPEPREVAECAWCGREIYEGDEVARVDDGGGYVHEGDYDSCADQYARERVFDAIGVIDRNKNIS